MSAAQISPADPMLVTDGRHPARATAGTGVLIGLLLRRDRIKVPVWLVGITLFAANLARLPQELAATAEGREDMTRFMEGGLGAVFGPGYGRDDVTAGVYFASVYGLIFFVLAALMSMLLVARHTRAEEQTGRAELVRAGGVGRHAPLAAALTVAIGANLVLACLLASVLAVSFDGGDPLLFGAGVAAVGMVFAAVTATCSQLSEHSRTSTSMASAVLGFAWAVRVVGDLRADHGSALSWLSPLAWSNQTRPYVDGRWWPLLLSVLLTAAAVVAAFALSSRRDFGAGLVPARAGRPGAATWLGSPLAAAFRLQRSALGWWALALATFGLIFGALAPEVADPDGISDDRIAMFGGSLATVVDGFLGIITLLIASLVAVAAVLGVQAMRAEETSGRAEPVLATATSRWQWAGSHLAVLAIGVTCLLAVVGFASGVGAALALDDGTYVAAVTAAHLAHAPGVLVLLGLAVGLYGVLPRVIGATWLLLGIGLFAGMFGPMTDLPQWLRNLTPLEHVGRPPLDDISWTATAALLVIAAALAGCGLAGFGRRDLQSST